MPIPQGYSRATFYGHLPNGEIFNWSLWSNQAPSDQNATQTMATAFATKFQARTDSPAVGETPFVKLMGSDSGYDGVRVYSYTGTNGKATYIADAPITRPGSSSATSLLPNQCAIVCTLKTAVAGRRSTGRVYIPIVKWNLASQGQLGSSDCSGIATALSKLITDLNSAESPQHVGVLSLTYNQFQTVNAVKVDSKVDIQRRRANHEGVNATATVVVT